MSEKAAPSVKKEVLELADKIEKALKIEKEAGVISASVDVYNENLPEGVTPKLAKELKDYDATYIAAGAVAVGRVGVELMAKDKKLEKITSELAIGQTDTASYVQHRQKEYTNRLSGKDEKVVKFGILTPTYDVRGGKNSGQLKAARDMIASLAMEKLK